jgi:hypothetical protein
MSSAKIQVIANARDLHRTSVSIKNELLSAEVRDPITKKTYPIKPFLKMAMMHILTKIEMRGRGLGPNWKLNHYLVDAEYFVEHAGYPQGKLPCHVEYCN